MMVAGTPSRTKRRNDSRRRLSNGGGQANGQKETKTFPRFDNGRGAHHNKEEEERLSCLSTRSAFGFALSQANRTPHRKCSKGRTS